MWREVMVGLSKARWMALRSSSGSDANHGPNLQVREFSGGNVLSDCSSVM